ncbi:carboxyl transferase domain-containing protein [Marispirochaeta sp.]|uniref:ATP-binding protein n=1 Tax=Marispirochaeta sp. TaxID=2038653 RepID=UPI0029C8A2E8|nr:carboxyl transferase domain-containing protein [Marispirochaeta sp.]
MAPQTAIPVLHDYSRIGIVNRGEAALRFIRGVIEYNSRFGTDLKTVAIYTAKEEQAPFVKNADYWVCFEDLSGYPGTASSPYLDHTLILQALKESRCDALWVGWGFVSEDAVFTAAVEKAGYTFLGPGSNAMALLGDKIAAKELADKAKVPILPWSRGPVSSIDEARRVAEKIGYPVIVKASNAGGGRGIRFVLSPGELETQYNSAVEETLRVTGTRTVFIEHLVQRGRHLEVQVLADRHGIVNTFGVRDCSLQRRNQKIIEETPPAGLSSETIAEMEASAARLIKAASYESAGTVEYLYDLDSDKFYFMEVNTRLQVEHPITEELYGIDLVTGQIEVAFGRKVDLTSAVPRGHVMEARLNAEDPGRDFSPAPGKVDLFRPPAGPGIRIDSGIENGAEIPPEFDSMVAKIIARGRDRREAASRLKRALDECAIRIENGTTNRAFLRQLLDQKEVAAGGVSTAYVGELLKKGIRRASDHSFRAALVTGAITIARQRVAEEQVNFLNELASLGKPRILPKGEGQEISLSIDGALYYAKVFHVGGEGYHVIVDNTFLICRYRCTNEEGVVEFNSLRYRFILVPRGDSLQCEINGTPFLLEQESRGFVKSPSPAIVLSVPVQAGGEVKKGSVLMVLEAMKMEMLIEAPMDGLVAEILASPGTQVAAGQSLVRLEEGGDNRHEEEPAAVKVAFPQHEPCVEESWQRIVNEVRALFLGFDTAEKSSGLTDRLAAFIAQNSAYKEAFAKLVLRSMEGFCALEILFSNRTIEDESGGRPHTYTELLNHYALRRKDREKGLPDIFNQSIDRILSAYREAGVSDEIDRLLYHLYRSHAASGLKGQILRDFLQLLEKWSDAEMLSHDFPLLVNEIVRFSNQVDPKLADAALHARYVLLDQKQLQEQRGRQRHFVESLVAESCSNDNRNFNECTEAFLDLPPSALTDLMWAIKTARTGNPELLTELAARYFHRDRFILSLKTFADEKGLFWAQVSFREDEEKEKEPEKSGVLFAVFSPEALTLIPGIVQSLSDISDTEVTVLVSGEGSPGDYLHNLPPFPCTYCALGMYPEKGEPLFTTYKYLDAKKWVVNDGAFTFSPLEYRELRVERFRNFYLRLISRSENVTVLEGRAKENEKDMRLFALASTSETDPELSSRQDLTRMPRFERVFNEAVSGIRAAQQNYRFRLQWNRIIIYNRSLLGLRLMQLRDFGYNLVPRTIGLGLEKMVVYSRRKRWREETIREHELIFYNLTADQFTLRSRRPTSVPLTTLDSYALKVVRARQRNEIYPYELIKMITHAGFPLHEGLPRGEFEEFDIEVASNGSSRLVSVKGREPGNNSSNIIFGKISNSDPVSGTVFQRILILSDPTGDLGSLAEGECRRIISAIDMAEQESIPVEWVPVSSGARITMDSGTENLDWTAAALKRIIEFTQAGGEINIIVQSINVGAQSYWNAEATMLMHTRGLLIMTDEASMLLTGKRALDFSGSVSGETNVDIGGAEKVMVPNGQAQIRVSSVAEAYGILFQHYRTCYVSPGSCFPGQTVSRDSVERNVTATPYRDNLGQGFSTIGDIFSRELNPDRKKPFDMRQVMRSLIDKDAEVLERWRGLEDGDTALVWETRLGGYAVGMIGIESRSFPRIGALPSDGPDTWSGGTLYPQSSRKVARGLNAFSGRVPAVIIANLSGFDGSPESLRRLQLEYGAEIGRAVVNFKGPIVFLVTARYHGGAYVVFSKRLNSELEVAALEGSFASVIGGAPAAAVVFPKTVRKRAENDSRVIEARSLLKSGEWGYKEFEDLYQAVYNEHQTALGAEFDGIHSVERAREVGSIDRIVKASQIRPYLIDAVRRGMARWEAR